MRGRREKLMKIVENQRVNEGQVRALGHMCRVGLKPRGRPQTPGCNCWWAANAGIQNHTIPNLTGHSIDPLNLMNIFSTDLDNLPSVNLLESKSQKSAKSLKNIMPGLSSEYLSQNAFQGDIKIYSLLFSITMLVECPLYALLFSQLIVLHLCLSSGFSSGFSSVMTK